MPKRNLIWILAILAGTTVLAWVTHLPSPQTEDNRAVLRPLADTYDLIRENSLYPPETQALLRGAAEGMVKALDEYSTYIPADKQAALQQRLMGVERGLGLRIRQADGQIVVVGPLAGSPAHHVGIVSGDLLAEIDGKPTAAMSLEEVRSALDGEVGTAVRLTIIRDGWRKGFQPTREEFPIESVTGLYRDRGGSWVCGVGQSGIAYLRIREFVPDTPEQVQRLLRPMDRLGGLVLDLRGNPGGMLEAAVGTADLFLSEGLIVRVVRRNRLSELYQAQPLGTFPPVPMVVLIDSRTASAAEIVAGALRAHDRAVLVGMRTCGKGCAQKTLPLPGDLGQVSLTTSEFYLAGPQPIARRVGADRWGVDPHEQVILLPSAREALADLRDQAEVLPSSRQTSTAPSSSQAANQASLQQRILEADAPLARAIELLGKPSEMEILLRSAAAERAARRTKTASETATDDPAEPTGLEREALAPKPAAATQKAAHPLPAPTRTK